MYRPVKTSLYCPNCRNAYYKRQQVVLQGKKDEERRIKFREEGELYEEELHKWRVLSLTDVPTAGEKTLCVLGNGFDLMHGVQSSYYDFAKTIGRNTPLRFYLETYLDTDDLWADFENALAQFHVESMNSSFLMDNRLDDLGGYGEDASAAAFFMAADMAALPITTIAEELPRRFSHWVDTLRIRTDDRPMDAILGKGMVLNFNYTEFAEECYGVSPENICYIHGCRKRSKGKQCEKLILGHASGASDAAYDYEDAYPSRRLSAEDWNRLSAAQETALRHIADADDALTKPSHEMILKHSDFFQRLSAINTIIVIGHSLYPVDWDYYGEIIRHIDHIESLEWYIGCYGLTDLRRLDAFLERFSIDRERVSLFRTDKIRVVLNTSATDSGIAPNSQIAKKITFSSDDKRWEVCISGKRAAIKGGEIGEDAFMWIAPVPISGAVFDMTGTYLMLIAKGFDKGVFLFGYQGNQWKYIRELEGIPNQGVITKRLQKVLQEGEIITFVYRNRLRKYRLSDGEMILNKGMQKAGQLSQNGKDITDRLLRIYSNGFC